MTGSWVYFPVGWDIIFCRAWSENRGWRRWQVRKLPSVERFAVRIL